MRPLLAFLFTAGLLAQGHPWQALPARDGAPMIQYRLVEQGQGLRLEVRAGALDISRWAFHLWLGDPRMVEERRRHLQEIRTTIAEEEALLQDPNHQEDYCQEGLKKFIEEARGAQQRFRGYDPYEHVQLTLGGPDPERPAGLRRTEFSPRKAGGSVILEAVIPFDGGFDVFKEPLNALSYGLVLVPRSNKTLVPLKSPMRFPLKDPWHITPFLAPGMSRIPKLIKHIAPELVFIHQADGYHPGELGRVDEVGCYGVEGRWAAAEPWTAWSANGENQLDTRSTRLRFSFLADYRTKLIVQRVGEAGFSILDLEPDLDSGGEIRGDLLDSSESPTATYLLISIEGASVLHGGGGMCGGGTEANLVWLKLGRDGHLKAHQSFHIESCFASIEADFHKGNEDGEWTWEWDVYSSHETHTVSYDPRHPELGLSEEIEPNQGD